VESEEGAVLIAEVAALEGPRHRQKQSERARMREANARLIAAAPTLLAACEAVDDGANWDENGCICGDALRKVSDAIRKAKGQ
jgi:hypothetical protein